MFLIVCKIQKKKTKFNEKMDTVIDWPATVMAPSLTKSLTCCRTGFFGGNSSTVDPIENFFYNNELKLYEFEECDVASQKKGKKKCAPFCEYVTMCCEASAAEHHMWNPPKSPVFKHFFAISVPNVLALLPNFCNSSLVIVFFDPSSYFLSAILFSRKQNP